MLILQAGIIWYRLSNPSRKQTPLLQMSALMPDPWWHVLWKHDAYLNVLHVDSGMCFHSERIVPHKLFTPLLTGMVATGVLLTLILMVLLYKYMQVRKKNNFYNTVALKLTAWPSIDMSGYHYSELFNKVCLPSLHNIYGKRWGEGPSFSIDSSLHSNHHK